jgi:hypothetical protein
MKYLFTIITLIFLMSSQVNAQDKIGAIKTEKGFLLYYNYAPPFTIDLSGNIDLSDYPAININGNMLEFNYGNSKNFGKEEKEILIKYMKWEKDYIIQVHNKSIETGNRLVNNNGTLINLWFYINPNLINDDSHNNKQFYADFYKDQKVYSLSYLMFKGSDKDAEESLIKIINNLTFYDKQIDVLKLSNSILKGELYKN